MQCTMQAGSKAELVMAIAMLATQPRGSLLTCNGYKDTEYMELVQSWSGLGLGSGFMMRFPQKWGNKPCTTGIP